MNGWAEAAVKPWHAMSVDERAAYELGRIAGHLDGYEAGWRAADEHAERAHRAAFRVVQALAKVEPFEVCELKRENKWLRFQLDAAHARPTTQGVAAA